MRDSGNVFSAMVSYDPKIINFRLLERSTIETPTGLKMPAPEIQLLGPRILKNDESGLVDEISLSTYITLHPNGRSRREDMERVVLDLLNGVIDKRTKGFYGGFKTEEGILNQVEGLETR